MRASSSARTAPIGVIWPNNRDVAELAPYLDRLALVALVFPTFRDGRAYSQARLLRERYGYRGRAARHRPGAARPVRVHAARRLRRLRGQEGRPTRRPSPPTAERYSVFYQPTGDGRGPGALHAPAQAAQSGEPVS